jgi:hypothetical protein
MIQKNVYVRIDLDNRIFKYTNRKISVCCKLYKWSNMLIIELFHTLFQGIFNVLNDIFDVLESDRYAN